MRETETKCFQSNPGGVTEILNLKKPLFFVLTNL